MEERRDTQDLPALREKLERLDIVLRMILFMRQSNMWYHFRATRNTVLNI